MPRPEEGEDPRSGIRAVILTGFLAGNIFGLLYFLLTGYLLQAWWFDWYALAATIGTMIGVGVFGTMVGTLVGLSTRMLLIGMRISQSWLPPVILSGLVSGAFGLCVTVFLVAALFGPSK